MMQCCSCVSVDKIRPKVPT